MPTGDLVVAFEDQSQHDASPAHSRPPRLFKSHRLIAALPPGLSASVSAHVTFARISGFQRASSRIPESAAVPIRLMCPVLMSTNARWGEVLPGQSTGYGHLPRAHHLLTERETTPCKIARFAGEPRRRSHPVLRRPPYSRAEGPVSGNGSRRCGGVYPGGGLRPASTYAWPSRPAHAFGRRRRKPETWGRRRSIVGFRRARVGDGLRMSYWV